MSFSIFNIEHNFDISGANNLINTNNDSYLIRVIL